MYAHYAVGMSSRELSDQEFQRLLNIIGYSTDQLKSALGTKDLMVVHLRDRLWFPWFTPRGFYGEVEDYNYLVGGLCDLAKRYPYCPARAYIRRQVQWLLWEVGLDVAPIISDRSLFGDPSILPDWYNKVVHTLSDIRTRLFRRAE